jgi:hypothetical protein
VKDPLVTEESEIEELRLAVDEIIARRPFFAGYSWDGE